MKGELKGQGYDVSVVAINGIDADKLEYQQNLIERSTFPLLQDTDAVKAWEAMGGDKDDMYIYGKDGTLAVYLAITGPTNTNLAQPDGYLNVKNALIAASELKK